MTATLTVGETAGADGDFAAPADVYRFAELLTGAERAVLAELRAVLGEHVRPLLADYWERGEFPYQVLPRLVELDLMRPAAITAEGGEPSALYHGFRTFELARVDASLATMYNAQSGLFRTAVARGGSAGQVAALDPRIRSFDYTGVFALTEPDHGSDVARGMATTARRDGDEWVIDGAKRWIGGAFTVDVIVVFAAEPETGALRAFLVPRESPGLTLRKIGGKTALRMMQNADIALHGVRVPESARLPNVHSFADVAEMLRRMRSDVAWIATGVAAGAYEAAVRYTTTRTQFGRPIGGFQLVQEKLARMLANVTACLGAVVRLTQLQEGGTFRDEDSALAKMLTSLHMRETVALAREVCGGNGITLETDVARFHADAEAVYSYEGTHEINALIVGRSITGRSAFNR
ncbi:acyl-CoA dehydrogenase family protein [Nakamurella sp.]|uniref:acyl-CoA dehydrogenase family protein n=1 Tax=Nakamurella sp. TaxID=1869182 RepID=UPI003B3B24D9